MLDLFTREELVLPFQRLQAEFGESFTQVQLSKEMRQWVSEVIVQAINEMRPRNASGACVRTCNPWRKSGCANEKYGCCPAGRINLARRGSKRGKQICDHGHFGQIKRLGNDNKLVQKQ